MSKRIIAVNAGPRKGWNTDTLIVEASKGAQAEGAEVERFDLFRLERYTGCISCFGCKRERFKGHCVCRDGLTPVLDAIRESDGLIIGSPNYLGELTASFRALYERLVFQNLTYNADVPCCNQHPIPVLLIMTSNAPDTMYMDLLHNYRQTLSSFVGPTQLLVSGDTLQLRDYSKTDWPWFFDGEAKQKRHETVFPEEMKKLQELLSDAVDVAVNDYMASVQAKKEMEMKTKKDRNLEKIRQWRIDAEQGQQFLFEDETKVYSKRKYDQEIQEIETIHSEASKYINDMNTLKGDPFVRPLAVFYNF